MFLKTKQEWKSPLGFRFMLVLEGNSINVFKIIPMYKDISMSFPVWLKIFTSWTWTRTPLKNTSQPKVFYDSTLMFFKALMICVL